MSKVLSSPEPRFHVDPHHPSNWCVICGLYYSWHDECPSHETDPLDRSKGHKFKPDLNGTNRLLPPKEVPPEEGGGW